MLLCLDCIRKDIYDDEVDRTAELVDISVPDCRAGSSWSVPSRATMFSGQLPSVHDIHVYAADFGTLDRSEVLTTKDTFERAYSVSANDFASPESGFDSWFDECVVVNSTAYYPEALDTRETAGILDHFRSSLGHEHPVRSVANGVVRAAVKTSERLPVQRVFDEGARSIHRASTRLLADGTEPSCLFVNMMDAHDPLRLVREYRKTEVERKWSSHDPHPAGTEPRDESFFEEYPDYAET